MLTTFDPQALQRLNVQVKTSPRGFRYGFVTGIFREDIYEHLKAGFPPVEKFLFIDKDSGGGHKVFYVGPNYYSGSDEGCVCHLSQLSEMWQRVLQEAASDEFMQLLHKASGIPMNSLCNFGFAYGKEGCYQTPHIDGAARVDDPSEKHSTIACLLYFNKESQGPGGTCVYETDRKTIVFQVPSLRNSFFFFEQHPDSWHGFPKLREGQERRLLSLSYSNESEPLLLKRSWFHRATCTRRLRHTLKRIIAH